MSFEFADVGHDQILFNNLFACVDNLLTLTGGQSLLSCSSNLFGAADKLVRAVVEILRFRVIHRRQRSYTEFGRVAIFKLGMDDEDCLPFVREALGRTGLRANLIPETDEALAAFLKARLFEGTLSEALASLLLDTEIIAYHYDRDAVVQNREMVESLIGVLYALDSQDPEQLELMSLIRSTTDCTGSKERTANQKVQRDRLKSAIQQALSKITKHSKGQILATRLQLQADQNNGLGQLEPRRVSTVPSTMMAEQMSRDFLADGSKLIQQSSEVASTSLKPNEPCTREAEAAAGLSRASSGSYPQRSLGAIAKIRLPQQSAGTLSSPVHCSYETDYERCLESEHWSEEIQKEQNSPRTQRPNVVNADLPVEGVTAPLVSHEHSINDARPFVTEVNSFLSPSRPSSSLSSLALTPKRIAAVAGPSRPEDGAPSFHSRARRDVQTTEDFHRMFLQEPNSIADVYPHLEHGDSDPNPTRSLPEHLNEASFAWTPSAGYDSRQRKTHMRSRSDSYCLIVESRRFSPQRRHGQTDEVPAMFVLPVPGTISTSNEDPSALPTGGWRAPMPTSRQQTLAEYIESGHFSLHQEGMDRDNAHMILSEAVMQGINVVCFNKKVKIATVLAPNFRSQEEHVDNRPEINRVNAKLRRLPSSSTKAVDGDDSKSGQAVTLAPSDESLQATAISNGSEANDSRINNASVAKVTPLTPMHPNITRDTSAEAIALALLRHNEDENLPKPKVSDIQWRTDYENHLEQIPSEYRNGMQDPHTRHEVADIRGTSHWAPPRAQLVLEIREPKKLSDGVRDQNFLCRGCGFPVEAKYMKKFRYCAYFGAYFCTTCHSNKKSLIPAEIIHRWNFKEEPVSDYAGSLINSFFTRHRIDIQIINPDLVQKVARLRRAVEDRRLAAQVFPFIVTCKKSLENRLRDRMVTFEFENPGSFTLNELVEVRIGSYSKDLKVIIDEATAHILACEGCKRLGHLCEGCRSEDILFPFQASQVYQCPNCFSCFHTPCFDELARSKKECSKCQRIKERKEREVQKQDDE